MILLSSHMCFIFFLPQVKSHVLCCLVLIYLLFQSSIKNMSFLLLRWKYHFIVLKSCNLSRLEMIYQYVQIKPQPSERIARKQANASQEDAHISLLLEDEPSLSYLMLLGQNNNKPPLFKDYT